MFTRRSELQAMMRALDPADPRPSGPDTRRELIARISSVDPSAPPPVVDTELSDLTPERAARRPRRLVVGVVLAAVVAAVAGGVIGVRESGRTAVPVVEAGPPGEVYDAATIAKAERAVVATNPAAAGRLVDCNVAPYPAWRLALPGGAEKGTSPEAAGLRGYLADNPWAWAGEVTGGNWILLAETDDQVAFGQRTGRVGIGEQVVLKRAGDVWKPSSNGCGVGLIPELGDKSQYLDGARVVGSTLRLTWGGVLGDDGCFINKLRRVEMRNTADGLHVLMVLNSRWNLPPGTGCAGVGKDSTVSVPLTAPYDGGPIFDDSRIPSAAVARGS